MEMECHTFYRSTKKIKEHKGNRGKKIPEIVQAKCFNCPENASVIVPASNRFWRERDRSWFVKRKVFSFFYPEENTFLW